MDNMSIIALGMLSAYLNERADAISARDISMLAAECGISYSDAFSALLAGELGVDPDADEFSRKLYADFFRGIGVEQHIERWQNDPYYKNIRVPLAREGRCELARGVIKAGAAFVCGDMRLEGDKARVKLGFFMDDFEYPMLLRDSREWMTITPNEIITSQKAIDAARGDVVTFGLGLGYFAYIVSLKSDVRRVTCVDNDPEIIKLFSAHILPQFPAREKIRVIRADAFEYLENTGARHDFAFCDIWHDALDGRPLYKRFKALESRFPETEFNYWIEDTIKCYLRCDMVFTTTHNQYIIKYNYRVMRLRGRSIYAGRIDQNMYKLYEQARNARAMSALRLQSR